MGFMPKFIFLLSINTLLVDGFCYVAREALDRLQVRWEPGSAEKEYNEGKTQQSSYSTCCAFKSRLRRVIRLRRLSALLRKRD